MRTSVRVLFLLLILASTSFAIAPTAPTGNKDLSIEGQQVEYDHNFTKIEATGNVVLTYRGSTLNTQVFYYNLGKKKILIPQIFTISHDKNTIEAQNFTYDLAKLRGEANDIQGRIEPWFIYGKKIELTKTKISIYDASFTTCGNTAPHYHMSSKLVEIYPVAGLMVAFDNYINTSYLPFSFWIPTYIYGNTYGPFSIFNTPVPRFGNSNREGSYIKESVPYFLSTEQNGIVEFGILSRLGPTVGVSHRYNQDPSQAWLFSLNYYGSDGLGGGIKYDWFYAPIVTPKPESGSAKLNWMKDLVSSFSTEPLFSTLRGSVSWMYGTLSEDSRIDRKPYADVWFSDLPVFDTGFNWHNYIGGGYLSENSLSGQVTSSSQGQYLTSVDRFFPITPYFSTWSGFSLDGRFYNQNKYWERIYFNILGQFSTWLNPKIGYAKRLMNIGESPFYFEKHFAVEYDELSGGISEHFGDVEVAFDFRYVVDLRTYSAADLLLGYRMHCWKFLFKSRLLDGFTSFGIELL